MRAAEGNRPSPDGTTQRAHWVQSAKSGNAIARAKLRAPRFPDSLGYLYDWFRDLSARRAVVVGAMGAPAHGPITDEQVRAWRENMRVSPAPHEVQALFTLDAAQRYAMSTDAPEQGTGAPVSREITRAWPVKKPQPSEAS